MLGSQPVTGNPRVITGPHFITTSPIAISCDGCGRPVLAATVGGIDRHVDPTPLNPAGELAALLGGRPTYDLTGAGADHLIRRTAIRITAGRARGPVLADHTCQPTPTAHIDHDQAPTVTRLAHAGGPDEPPF